jgi:hypothetical protein
MSHEKKLSQSTKKGGPQQDFLVHSRAPADHQAHAVMLAPSATLGGTPELIDAKVVLDVLLRIDRFWCLAVGPKNAAVSTV